MKINLTDSISLSSNHPDENIHVHLGITMAGAVSGGAYTAGVMDYLFDTLDKWEEKKSTNRIILANAARSKGESATWNDAVLAGYDLTVPMHNVTIDALGGASAGAIATVLSALKLYRNYKGNGKSDYASDSMLYDAWVNLSETESKSESTFMGMLNTTDISSTQPLMSLLSSSPLDATKNRIMSNLSKSGSPVARAYAPREINLVLTITSLRPAPMGFKLSSSQAHSGSLFHEMKMHRGLARYTLINDSNTSDQSISIEKKGNYLTINPQNDSHLGPLFDIALASGAFPVGLPPRQIDNLPMPYVRDQLKRMFHLNRPDSENKLKNHFNIFLPEGPDKMFDMYAVDGGVMNNDPFAEVNRVLQKKVHKLNIECEGELHISANIFIDPFPNFHKDTPYKPPTSILSAAGQLISALLSQSRMKSREILEEFVSSTNYGMVFPSYNDADNGSNSDVRRHPLASGGLGGFSGFLDRRLREFDYELGKRNAKSFLRHYFYIQKPEHLESEATMNTTARVTGHADIQQELFMAWFGLHDSLDSRSKRFNPKEGTVSIPVIPDIGMGEVQTTGDTMTRDPLPHDKRALRSETINRLKRPLRRRARKIIHTIITQSNNESGHANALLTMTFTLSLITLIFKMIFGISLIQTAMVLGSTLFVIYISIYVVLPILIAGKVLSIIKGELKERGQLTD